MTQKTLGEEFGVDAPKRDRIREKAIEMSKGQKEIGVAEFFSRNRHLLGFDNKRKALMTTVKEAVDNSIDACEEAGILPEISVELIQMGTDKYKIIIEDNGPGIVKKQVPNIFGRLLYGSKFHKLKMSRGQQGIGISACVMYAQLTTGKATKVISRISPNEPAVYMEIKLNTSTNRAEVKNDREVEWVKPHGIKIELDMEASYIGGAQSVDQYLKETAIINPHVTIIYTNPKAQQIIFARATDVLPKQTEEIKPHPYGVELGILMEMAGRSEYKTLQSFLQSEFSRVSANTAKQICQNAALLPKMKPKKLSRELAEKLMNGIKQTKIMAPSSDCIAPIGEEMVKKGLKKEINAEFYCSATRPASVYRGNPFIVEVGLAYGGNQQGDTAATIMRFANKVPLLYQQSACATFKGITGTNWRSYGLSQPGGSMPVAPITILIHIASVWVPFTSESKEAIAHYPEIITEIKKALQVCGRELNSYVSKKKRVGDELKKRSYIEKYIPHVAIGLKEILKLTDSEESNIVHMLEEVLEQKRGKLEEIKIDNADYDAEFAKIGKEDKTEKGGDDDE